MNTDNAKSLPYKIIASFFLFLTVLSCNIRKGDGDKLPLGVSLEAETLGQTSLSFLEEELGSTASSSLLLRRAQLYYEREQYGEALEDIYRILDKDSEMLQAYTLKALIHYKLGSIPQAAEAANFADSLGDESKDLFFIKTLLLSIEGKIQQADIYMGNALALAPYSGDVWWANGKLNLAKGDSIEAVKSLKRAILFDTQSTYIYEDLIDAFKGAGELDSALTYSEKAIKSIENNESFKLGKAGILEQVGNLDSALVVYQSIFKENPDRLEILTQMGNIYFKKRSFGKAFAKYSEVLQKLPDNANIQYLAGRSQEKMGYYGTAQSYYIKARTNQPENELYDQAFRRARYLQERKIQRQVNEARTEEKEQEPTVQRKTFSIERIDPKKKVKINQ